jgi:hypothetical protein
MKILQLGKEHLYNDAGITDESVQGEYGEYIIAKGKFLPLFPTVLILTL